MEKDNSTIANKNFTEKHRELWKFIKFTMAGTGSSIIELIVHMLLINFVFYAISDITIDNNTLNFLGIRYAGYLYSFLISTTVGYSIAFIINRKVTFKADANPTLSIFLYIILVIFTIVANTWIGSALSILSVNNEWGNIGDLIIKVLVMIIPTLWTYPTNRFIIHRKKTQK